MISLTPVKSSNLAAVGYDPATRTLAVRFTGTAAKVYHYKDVPAEAHTALMAADSIGRHYSKSIRTHFHHTVVLDETPV